MKKDKSGDPDSPENKANSSLNGYHIPVMLTEVIDGLAIQPGGVYVDCTFGGGGHSKEILKHLSTEGRLIAFDQDADARANLIEDSRFVFIPHNFRHLQRFLRVNKFLQVDGIMADLGVSSHQFNEGERGFSTRFDGDLDMRMDQRQKLKARDIIETYSESRLHKLFEQYGEVTNSKTLARTIASVRDTVSLKTISNFKTAVSSIVKGNPNKYFAQVFQALRIEVNDELGALKEMLQQAVTVLRPGGRLVVLTFHSLEDRIVKNFFKKGNFEEDDADTNPFQYNTGSSGLKIVTKKPLVAGQAELQQNPRSRSAKLRIAEKI
ncbi:MAG: 16S rRNA (cytosine(1402)-N(4))-methyltransferase RsmH [Chitinophagaceae bacterium]|nr:16S rRNA (cytosine(1402)-N(4))-methyltransferase RsmH [Chitinophagaceae bacterium]